MCVCESVSFELDVGIKCVMRIEHTAVGWVLFRCNESFVRKNVRLLRVCTGGI